jgi:drug/metabolite transporter (DMT)-like permease
MSLSNPESGHSNKVGIFVIVRVVGAIFLLAAFAVAAASGQLSFGIGLVLGGAIILGWAGAKVSKGFENQSTNRKVESRSNIEFVVMGTLIVLPMTIIGILSLLLASGDPFLKLCAGGCFSYAFSMALFFLAIKILLGQSRRLS